MYKIIVYELVIINVNVGNRIIKKKYFNKVYSLHNVASNEISYKSIELKRKYNEFRYIFSIIKENDVDWYIENMNQKSVKYYNMSKGGESNEI